MNGIEFGRDEKAAIVRRIQHWFGEELGQEIGQFDAEFLLDFFAREIGPLFYNRAVQDAIAAVDVQMDTVKDGLWALEKPTDVR